MKKILIILMIVINCFSTEFVDIQLKDYLSTVSKTSNMTLIIDDSIEKNFSIYLSADVNEKDYYNVLRNILRQNNLILKRYGKTYYIAKRNLKNTPENEIHFYTFKYLKHEEIKNILKVYKLSYSYDKRLKTAFIDTTKKNFKKLETTFKKFDTLPTQRKLKITIVDTNLNKLKDYGVDNTLNIKNSDSDFLFFNLLAFPFTAENILNASDKSSFTSYIKFLNEKNITNIVSSPTVSIFDNKETVFEVVKNIPYKSGSTTTDDNGNTRTTESLEYKDIGLKLNVNPIIDKNRAFLDISLTIENILDSSDTPVTSKKYFKQYISLKEGDIFVLNGINQIETYNDDFKTPFLSDIPYIGWLFKSEYENLKESNLTILIELM